MTYLIPMSPIEFFVLAGQGEHYWLRREIMNPFDDPFLDYLHSLMLGCLSGIEARPPNQMRNFWNQMPVADQLLAEIEAEILSGVFKDLHAIQAHYIFTEYFPFADLPEPGTKEFDSLASRILTNYIADQEYHSNFIDAASDRGIRAFRPQEINPYIIASPVPSLLTPTCFPANRIQTSQIHEDLDLEFRKTQLMPLCGDAATQELLTSRVKLWRDEGVKRAYLLTRAYGIWSQEIANERLKSNTLIGPAGRTKTLLVDDSIPLVTPHNFHQWWSLCGIEAIRMHDHKPESFYIAFTHPHLAVTKDHLSNTIQSEDSHANHSLPGRSAGHMRTEFGRIIHGRHYISAFLNSDKIHQIDIENSMMTRPGAKLRQDMPWLPTRRPDVIWGKQDDLYSSIADPWQMSGDYLFWDWIRDYPISTSMRFIAKSIGYHFMFTDTPSGKRALDAWIESMAQTALQWCYWMEGNERELRITCMMGEQAMKQMQFKQAQSQAKTKSSKRFNFDLSGLNL